MCAFYQSQILTELGSIEPLYRNSDSVLILSHSPGAPFPFRSDTLSDIEYLLIFSSLSEPSSADCLE